MLRGLRLATPTTTESSGKHLPEQGMSYLQHPIGAIEAPVIRRAATQVLQ